MRAFFAALLLAVCCLPGLAGQRIPDGLPPVDFDQDTLSLPPAYFPELPPQLATWLEERSYRIPQVHDKYIEWCTEGYQRLGRYNVVIGDFDGHDGQDWVVATFRDDTLKVFTCWNADTSSIEQLEISEFNMYPGGNTIHANLDGEMYPVGYGSFGYAGSTRNPILSFEIVTALVRCEWLNEDLTSGYFFNIHGDSTELPTVFHHDGLVLESGGDMFDGRFVRYYDKGRWIRFYHFKAICKAVLDTLRYKDI